MGIRRGAAVAVLLAILIFWAAALYGIDSPFYYGHYGYHGGSYATWARGTLRYHTLLPVNEPGFAPPRPGTYYIHHPVLTHQLVTLTFSIFGQHEWSVRLGALIPSFISLLLVTAIAWRRLGPLAGAVAALVFAVVPVNIWYSVNIDQGFPSIACLLGFFWFYLRWLDTGRWTLGIAALGLEFLAGGFEWSPYFAFPAIFTHVLWIAIKRGGRFRIFAALHPLVVLLPLSLHFVMVWRSGMLNDLLGAYHNRTADVTYTAFVLVMRQYGETLFGQVLMVVMVGWLLLTLVRILRGQGKASDLVGLTFVFALCAYVHVFKAAVVTHAYRQLYANVWAAWAVADLAVRAQKTITSLLQRKSRHAGTMGWVVALVGVAVVMMATVPVAWAGLIESRAHGGIPGWKTFDPDLRQTAFAREVNQATRPGDTIYFHTSFSNPPPHRMDWAFYYDRDLRRDFPLRRVQRLPPAEQKNAVAIVLPRSLSGNELRVYAELASHHPILHIDDLVMIDMRKDGPDRRALALAPVDRGHTGAVRRWLEGPYPWPRLVPDARLRAADETLVRSTLATVTAPPPSPPPPVPKSGVAVGATGATTKGVTAIGSSLKPAPRRVGPAKPKRILHRHHRQPR